MFGEPGDAGDVAELHIGVEGHRPESRLRSGGEVALELRHAHVRGDGSQPGIEDVSLTLQLGEVLGVAGVDGNGQRALAEAISGQRRLTHGEISYLGAPVASFSVAQREKLGLRYVTDDRLGEGIVAGLPLSVNFVLKRIGQAPYWRRGRIRRDAIDRDARELVERFDIRTPGIHARAGTLSGGNIQKVLLARELSFDAKVVVFHKPTYGLDVKTTRVVRRMIGELREGRAALLISTDLDELLEVSDRIAVLSRGRIVGVVDNGPGAAEQVGRLMIGDVTLGVESASGPELQAAGERRRA
jgi:simple sugar transport system ATP-binding protein